MGAAEDMNRLLNDDEIEEITGYSQPSMQCDALRKHGVFFIQRKDGRPRCTWYHINHPMGASARINSANEPDFSLLD